MIRNLKVLGLALVAVVALSAVVASAASAQNGLLTSDGPVTLIGKQPAVEPTKNNKLTAFGGSTECTSATYTGHKFNETPHKFIPSGANQITITPHYGPCTALGFPATVDMEGCDYVFDLGATTGVADTYSINSTVVCPTGKHITLTIFTSAANHTAGKPFCHITITENTTGYAGLTVKDLTNGKGEIKGTVAGISADKSSPTGSILCPTESTTTASLDQEVTVEGKNEAGGATNISLSHL